MNIGFLLIFCLPCSSTDWLFPDSAGHATFLAVAPLKGIIMIIIIMIIIMIIIIMIIIIMIIIIINKKNKKNNNNNNNNNDNNNNNNNNNNDNNNNNNNNNLYFMRVTQSNTGFDFPCGPINTFYASGYTDGQTGK